MGRGEGSKGKTAGRGTKGTKARYQVPAGFEGGQMPLHMRLPKLRGFKNPFRVEYQVVNLDRLAELYPEGGEVTVDDLVAKGAVRKDEPVKVLGSGDIAVALQVSAHEFSASAKEKIAAAGGTVDRALAAVSTVRGPARDRRRPACRPCSARTTTGSAAAPPGCPRAGGTGAHRVRSGVPDARPAQEAAVHPGHHRAVPARARPSRRPASTTRQRADAASSRPSSDTGLYSLVNLFSGGALLQLSVFALGIMPYITASIILQLLPW